MRAFFAVNQSWSVATIAFALAFFTLFACSKTETPSSSAESPADKLSQGAANTKYELGIVIKFGSGGDSERFRTSGWSQAEEQMTWTEGNSAVLSFSSLPPSRRLTLRMTLVPFAKEPELLAQPVEVYANGKKIADWQVTSKRQYTALIPADAIRNDGTLTLEFRIPKAASPQSLGLSTDNRQLGVAAFDLVIEKAP